MCIKTMYNYVESTGYFAHNKDIFFQFDLENKCSSLSYVVNGDPISHSECPKMFMGNIRVQGVRSQPCYKDRLAYIFLQEPNISGQKEPHSSLTIK
jgi:hypothetical protein